MKIPCKNCIAFAICKGKYIYEVENESYIKIELLFSCPLIEDAYRKYRPRRLHYLDDPFVEEMNEIFGATDGFV